MNRKYSEPPATNNNRNRWAFFTGFLRTPQKVGSLVPSSRFLERRILNAAGLRQAKLVLELGPGTGGTTRAILSHLPADARLLTIDVTPEFISLLDTIADPRLTNHLGSAEDLSGILAHHDLGAPDVVISGIPFSTMPVEVGENVARSVHQVLADGGRFVAYQFRGDVADITSPVMGKAHRTMEWLNVPPMRVYRWLKNGAPAADSVRP